MKIEEKGKYSTKYYKEYKKSSRCNKKGGKKTQSRKNTRLKKFSANRQKQENEIRVSFSKIVTMSKLSFT